MMMDHEEESSTYLNNNYHHIPEGVNEDLYLLKQA